MDIESKIKNAATKAKRKQLKQNIEYSSFKSNDSDPWLQVAMAKGILKLGFDTALTKERLSKLNVAKRHAAHIARTHAGKLTHISASDNLEINWLLNNSEETAVC